jgi:CRISPR/Cas system-associated exonuclease Cas4 (RecB family)
MQNEAIPLTPLELPTKDTQAVHLHFSFSQLVTYLMCPMKYAHQYVYGTPWETRPAALPFGKAIHKTAESYYLTLMETGEILPIEKLQDTFLAVFLGEADKGDIPLSFKKGEDLETLKGMGKELVRLFQENAQPQKIVAVEFPFSVKVPDLKNGGNLPVRLEGVFDLVESDSEKTYAVVELKTASQRFSSVRLAYDQQATVYSYAMNRMRVATSEKSCLVRYDVLLKTKKSAFEQYYVTRTNEDHQRLIELINEVLRAIEERVFYRKMDWQCNDCQFRKACFSA